MDHKRGKRAGQRGSTFRLSHHEKDERPTALRRGLPITPSQGVDSTSIADSAAKYHECAEVEETEADYLIPRQSLTTKLHLRLFPQRREFESLRPTVHHQADKKGKLVEVTNPKARLVWKSDRTLLNPRIPEKLEDVKFSRITSHSKVRRSERELPATLEESTDRDIEQDII